ncbi:putative uncharacterized protein [Waddlia chondrophila 2032/99]|uniref:GYF domain-containing protein n=1 Tax=Waddlia chondrophila 2032/99 TaxID=765953 RepID=F8LAD8_9BACT|nr:putative uncharacterized protein [Waddlia chondrophila 2032/99]
MMGKIWFLYINNKQEGPYSYLELSKDHRLTPDTFAWKEGMEDWKPIAEIDELNGLVDKNEEGWEETDSDEKQPAPVPDEQIVLEMKHGRPFPWGGMLIVLIILLFFYEYFWR